MGGRGEWGEGVRGVQCGGEGGGYTYTRTTLQWTGVVTPFNTNDQ